MGKERRMRRKLFLFAVIITVAAFFAAEAFPDIFVPSEAAADEKICEHEGRVLSVREKNGYHVIIIDDFRGFRVRTLLYDGPEDTWSLTGRRIRYRTRLSAGDPARNPHCFDKRKYIRSCGIFLTGTLSRYDADPIPDGYMMKYSHLLAGIRHEFEKRLPESCRGMMTGMLFGDTSGVSEDVYEDFRRNGTAHILAVSGLHIGLLYSIYEKLSGGKSGLLSTVILGFLMYSYGTLTLWSPSVVRAEMMISMKTAAKIKELRYDSLTAMSLAAVFLIAKNPYVIYGTGFQMSFLAIISINVLSGKLPEKIPESLTQAVSVNISMILYQAYVFNYVSPFAVLINIPVLYAAGIAIPAAFGTFTIFALTSAIYKGVMLPLFLIPASSVTELMVWINTFLANGGRSSFDTVSPPAVITVSILGVFLFLCTEYAGVLSIRKQTKKTLLIIAFILLLSLTAGLIIYEPIGHDEIVFVDVGQGACTHIRADGMNVLIDGGGNRDYNVGEKILKPYLLKNGTGKVDLSLATHEDMDHIKGLTELSECFDAEPPVIKAEAGRKYPVSDKTSITVLWPPEAAESKQGNEVSSVFMIDYDGIRVLVTGDLDMQGEKNMITYYRERKMENILKADILNVGHHGSAGSTSDELLDAVSPSAAVIQVGKNNYGHPKKEVLERLENHGVKVYRNDRMGAVGIDLSEADGETFIKEVHVMIDEG